MIKATDSTKLDSKAPYNASADKSPLAYHIMRASLALDIEALVVRFVGYKGKFQYNHTVHSQTVVLDSAAEKEKSPDFSGPQFTTVSDGGGTHPSCLVSSQLTTNLSLLDHAGQDDDQIDEVLNLFLKMKSLRYKSMYQALLCRLNSPQLYRRRYLKQRSQHKYRQR